MSLGHNGVLISQSTLVGSKAKGLMRQRFLPDLQLGRNPERGKLMEQQLLNWCEMHWSYMRKGAFFLSQKTRKALNLMKKWLTRTLRSRKICELSWATPDFWHLIVHKWARKLRALPTGKSHTIVKLRDTAIKRNWPWHGEYVQPG